MVKRTIAGVSFSSTLLSLLVIVFLAAVVIVASMNEKSDAQRDRQLIEVISALDDVAHNFAVERGLTAGFLGSGSAEAKAKVDKQRQQANSKREALNTVVRRYQDPTINSFTRLVVDQFSDLEATRSQVNSLNGQGVFLYYSQLNRLSLDAMASLVKLLENAELKDKINTLIQLAWYKERAGQVRGRVNGVLAKQVLNDTAKEDISFYQRELNTLKQYLFAQTHGEDQQRINALLNGQGVEEINDILQALLNSQGDFTGLPRPSDWFPLATSHIVAVKKLVDQNWADLHAKTDDIERSATITLIFTLVVIIIALSALLLLNLWLRGLLKRDLPSLISTLEQMASSRDLSVQLNHEGDHELARIALAVQHVVESMRQSLLKMQRVVELSQQVNNRLDASSQQLLENADSAQKMATNIATAIEENSSTSSEIAQSASHTMDNTRDIAEQTRASLAASQSAGLKLAKLQENAAYITDQSHQLTQNVTSITQTVGRINELFEQTNLLALNASIEAARAGEHGRGFAVVADEVRSLAFRSIEASDQIAKVLQGLSTITEHVGRSVKENNQLSEEAMQATEQNGQIMAAIADTLSHLESMSTSVAAATEEQYAVSQTIAQDASQVMLTANTSHEAAQTVKELAKQLDEAQLELRNAYQQFTL